jgi:hypothetical protein
MDMAYLGIVPKSMSGIMSATIDVISKVVVRTISESIFLLLDMISSLVQDFVGHNSVKLPESGGEKSKLLNKIGLLEKEGKKLPR